MGNGSHQWRGVAEAEITDVDDPEQKGRIKVNGRGITADGADVELDTWIPPKTVANYGLHLPPRVGDIVSVEFTSGDTSDTTHGETFLRNPNLAFIGTARRDQKDLDEEFRGKNYGNVVGFREPGASAGWQVWRDNDVAAFWGTRTYIGTVGLEDEVERMVGGAALGAWFGDFFIHMDTVLAQLRDFVSYIEYWADPTKPTHGWPVVDNVAKPPANLWPGFVINLSQLDEAWGKLIEMDDWIGNWQHDTVFLKGIEDAYEGGDGL